MSIGKFLVRGDCSLFYISSLSYVSSTFESHSQFKSVNSNTILQFLYEIRTPFLMDGEAQKLYSKFLETENEASSELLRKSYEDYLIQKIKNKKILQSFSLKEKENIDYVKRKFIEFESSSEFTKNLDFSLSLEDVLKNNHLSRQAKELFLSMTDEDLPSLTFSGTNESEEARLLQLNNHSYLLPPKSRYVNGDVFDLETHFRDEKFDLVLLDPPWRNKYIKRRKKLKGLNDSYSMLSVEEVMKIPLKRILDDDALVFFWISNNNTIYEDLLQMLKLWDLEFLTTWFWLKVTKAGVPVVSLTAPSNGKLPYEKLLVTRRRNSKRSISPNLKELVFCSVPCSVHSHKPPVKELFFHTLNVDENWKCLELFARSLHSNWTSLGNEVLKFQHISILNKFEGYKS